MDTEHIREREHEHEHDRFGAQLDTLIRVIAITLDEQADVAMLASEACMSRFHFQRVFRRAMGETPGALRRRLLLERAAHQLDDTAAGVTEIALDAGYDSHAGFSRAFRRAYGVSPSHYRRIAPKRFRLSCSNGIHYDPVAHALHRLGQAATQGADLMDLTDRLIEHDAWLTRRLLERARGLTDAQLDAPLASPQQPLPFESPENTLRKTLQRLVFTKEAWGAAVRGRSLTESEDNSVEGLLKRFDCASRDFIALVREVRAEHRWDDTFVDALCVPAETFTYGGMVAHVVTFSALRRTTAIKAFAAVGIEDLGYGDPIEWERSRER